MEQSQYFKLLQSYLPGVAADISTRINDSTNPANRVYRFQSMLTKKYSSNMEWSGLSTLNSRIVAANIIAMDSSIPLKRRDSFTKVTGEIPKMGIEMWKNEKQLKELQILASTEGQDSVIFRQAIFADAPKCIQAVPETIEYMLLQALSSGVTSITDTQNVGSAISIDFGYKSANKFGVPVVWSNPSSTPFADIAGRVLVKAQTDGKVVTKLMMDRTTFNRIAATTEAKQLFSFSIGYAGSIQQTPTLSNLNQALQDRYGFTIEIVERSMVFEKNGIDTVFTPWQAGMVVALTSNNVGSLVWSRVAEMGAPVPGVNYATVDDYILLSMFRANRPSLSEHTNSQAMVLPVIEGVDSIYTIDSTTVVA
jgi:hypothetical protein